jgi:hypothetical protein
MKTKKSRWFVFLGVGTFIFPIFLTGASFKTQKNYCSQGSYQGFFRSFEIRGKEIITETFEQKKYETLEMPKMLADEVNVKPTRSLFQIDLFGGFSLMSPSDLNLRNQYEEEFMSFYWDDYYQYYETTGSIWYWDKTVEGNFKKIKYAFPFGGRFRFNISKMFAISMSIKYFSQAQESSVLYNYDYNWKGSSQRREHEYSPYRLECKGFSPILGFHLGWGNRIFRFELFSGMGPLFAECSYSETRNYKRTRDDGYWYSDGWSINEEGKGIGLCLEGGMRFEFRIRVVGFFMEYGYAYQSVRNVSGPGSSSWNESDSTGYSDSGEDSWEGKWGIKAIDYDEEYGQETLQIPSNYWDTLDTGESWVRDFILDLSGFQFRIGISFYF